jgi:hypothetical protein
LRVRKDLLDECGKVDRRGVSRVWAVIGSRNLYVTVCEKLATKLCFAVVAGVVRDEGTFLVAKSTLPKGVTLFSPVSNRVGGGEVGVFLRKWATKSCFAVATVLGWDEGASLVTEITRPSKGFALVSPFSCRLGGGEVRISLSRVVQRAISFQLCPGRPPAYLNAFVLASIAVPWCTNLARSLTAGRQGTTF